MNITLPAELEKLVREKVARGEYDSADAFVGEAVYRLIEEQEEDAHRSEICACGLTPLMPKSTADNTLNTTRTRSTGLQKTFMNAA